MFIQTTVGERVRRLRVARGLGQVEMAERLQLASGAVSMLENGRLPLDDGLLSALGAIFDCSSSYFTAPQTELVSTRPWLRAYADASKKSVDRTVADSVLAMEATTILGLRRLPDVTPLFEGDLEDDEAIEQFASDVRATADLKDGDVVRNCIRAAERLGCIVLPMDDELGRHLGLSIRVDGSPVIRVSRPSEDPDRHVPGDRQRFTVAHEIGHLALHHSCPPPDSAVDAARYEKQAHLFAGAFLVPADAIIADLDELGGRVTLTSLSRLKERWGYSIKAFVVRFQQLGVIDADHSRSLYKQISARRWNKSEPVEVGNEDGQWLSKALMSRLRADNPSAAAALQSGLGNSYFERWMDWSPSRAPQGDATILSLGQRGPSGRPTTKSSASVTKLPIRAR